MACVNPGHLYWATPQENQNERVKHNTSNRGEQQWLAKLTSNDVLEIRKMLVAGFSQAGIARQYGLAPSTVSNIKTGKHWGWLK